MIDPVPERVTWYYGEWQSAYENLDIPNLQLQEGLPTSFDAGKRNVVVLDELMAESDGRVTDIFTTKSHHSNTSVIYLVQNIFSRNKESRTISLNTQYMVVFKNPRDASQITNLAKQMYPGRVKFIQEAFCLCDVNSIRVPFGRSQTGYSRRSAPAHIITTGRRGSVCIYAKSINSRARSCHSSFHDVSPCDVSAMV